MAQKCKDIVIEWCEKHLDAKIEGLINSGVKPTNDALADILCRMVETKPTKCRFKCDLFDPDKYRG